MKKLFEFLITFPFMVLDNLILCCELLVNDIKIFWRE